MAFSLFSKKQKKQDVIFDQFGDVNARWINLKNNEDYAAIFQQVPELYAIVTYSASQFSKGKWKCRNLSDGELIEDDSFLQKLNQPNPLLAKKEFLESAFIDYSIFGNQYNFFLTAMPEKKPSIDNIEAIYNLDARYTYPRSTGKLFYQTDLKEIIKDYIFDVKGQSYDFNTDHICHVSTNNIDFLNGAYVTGQSPLKSLEYALSNIKVAYEARNVYIVKRGAFGIISNNSTGDMGTQPMDDKDDIQDKLGKYGLTKSQYQFIVTNSNVKWEPISIPTKDLELYKEVRESVIAIANVYKFPILLLNYLEGSTFSNLEIAHRQLYSDSIIPFADHFAGEINRTIGAYEAGKEYYLDYSHIEALQKDKKLEAEKNKTNISTILSIQESVKNGTTSYDSAIQMLVRIFGFKENEAREILGEIKQQEDASTNTEQ